MRWALWLRYRIFLYLLFGLAAVDGLLVAGRRSITAYDPDDYLEVLEGCRRRRPDLVLVGGSPVVTGLDPAALTGLRWEGHALRRPFNLGMPGGTSSEVWHAVKHALREPPRLLIYGMTASDLNDSRQMPHGPWSLMDCGDLWHWLHCRPETAEWVCRQYAYGWFARRWKLYQYRNALRLWAADQVERWWPGSFPEAGREARRNRAYADALRRPDGFAPPEGGRTRRLDHYRAAGHVPPTFWALRDFHIGGGHLLYLQHMLDWAEANGVAVVLVDMPISPDLEEWHHPNEFRAYRAVLAEVARERGVALLSASRPAVGLTDADFCDEIHLNGSGCAKLSAWLANALSRQREHVSAPTLARAVRSQ